MYSQNMTPNTSPELQHDLLPHYTSMHLHICISTGTDTLHLHDSSTQDQDIRSSLSGPLTTSPLTWDAQTMPHAETEV